MNKTELTESFTKIIRKHLKESSSNKSYDDLIEILGNIFAYHTAQSMAEDEISSRDAKREAKDIGAAIGLLIADDFERIRSQMSKEV